MRELCREDGWFLNLSGNLFYQGILEVALSRMGSPLENLQIFQRNLLPFHEFGSKGIHSGYPPFPTGTVQTSEFLFPGILDEVAGDLALRGAEGLMMDQRLFTWAATLSHEATGLFEDSFRSARSGQWDLLAQWAQIC